MSYLDDLIRSAESPASAYLQFLTEKGREGYIAFAFVEDEDDIQFYQHVLTNMRDICFFGCGGKGGVLKIFDRLNRDGHADGNLFIVDRDSEVPPFEHGDAVLRTGMYSWEAHLCAPGILSVCLQRKAAPNLTAAQVADVEELWLSTMEAYREAFSLHGALLILRPEIGSKLELRAVRFSVDAVASEGRLEPGAGLIEQLQQKVVAANLSAAATARLEDHMLRLQELPILTYARGKTLFELARRFIVEVVRHMGSALREQISSPLQVLGTTRWDHPDFDYIRDYAAARIVASQ